MSAPNCDYCGNISLRATGADIYPRRPDLASKVMFVCWPCGAWVGCHPGTDKPLGRLANQSLRAAKMDAHAAFDPLWRGKPKGERGRAYAWLADQLGIPQGDCHIGMFDVETCKRVVAICAQRGADA